MLYRWYVHLDNGLLEMKREKLNKEIAIHRMYFTKNINLSDFKLRHVNFSCIENRCMVIQKYCIITI